MLTATRRESFTASPAVDVWKFFQRRFRSTYGVSYPWDGEGSSWPTAVANAGELGWLPTATQNGEAITQLTERAHPVEVCIRIDRMFRNAAHVRSGISLRRVATWWDDLASVEALNAKTAEVDGAHAARVRRAS